MEPITAGRSRKRTRRGLLIMMLFLTMLAAAGALFAVFYMLFWPNGAHEPYPFEGAKKPVFYKGKQLQGTALGDHDGLMLPISVYKELIDPAIFYEEGSESVIITTQDKVVRMKTSQLTGTLNEKPITLRFPVTKDKETVYIPIEPLKDLYQIEIREDDDTGAVIVQKAGDIIQWGSMKLDGKHPDKTWPLRSAATVKATIYSDVSQKEKVMIWGESNGWYRVQLKNGMLGYMKKSDVVLEEPKAVDRPEQKNVFIPWKPLGGKINLTWQQVYDKTPDPASFGPMPGLNVVSPQWFHLADGQGNLKVTADASFVQWAQKQKFQVWALFSNGFDPKQTSEALSSYDKRMSMIRQLLAYAAMYKIQGINIDFENVYLKDKANMVQFVRELTPFLHEQGLVVSIDVTVKDGSENYSLFMDRASIGQVVDYMMVMTYDEHWGTSPEAGSVASLPWVEKGIVQIMEEDQVPASKLVLGVPFYSRIWTEETKDGKTSVKSKAVGMDAVQQIISEKQLKPTLDTATGQNYVEYTEDGKKKKIWIEDEWSVRSRVELVRKYDLAGVASWSRGFEQPETWGIIKETLEKRP